MGWWSDFWYGPQPEPPDELWSGYEEMRRRDDPNYDERMRLLEENRKLRLRRDLLDQRREGVRLRQEIAELEGQRRCGCGGWGDHDETHEEP